MNMPSLALRPSRCLRSLPVVAALTFAAADPARAQAPNAAPSAANVAEAERLFEDAIRRMDARDYQAACPLLERSQALDPSSGTLLNLGDCYDQIGRTASAWRAFSQAHRLALATSRKDRVEVAELRMNQLAPRLRRVKVAPPTPASPHLSISLDGETLRESSWNTPLPVDPGPHVVRASAPGFAPYSENVPEPTPGTTTDVVVPALAPSPARGSTEGAFGSGADMAAPSRLDAQKIGAVVALGVSVVGITTGTLFGLHSRSKHEQSDEYCNERACTDRRGVELMNDARTAGDISTISFAVAGLGLGTAAVLWFVRPFGEEEPVKTELGFGAGSISVRGTF